MLFFCIQTCNKFTYRRQLSDYRRLLSDYREAKTTLPRNGNNIICAW